MVKYKSYPRIDSMIIESLVDRSAFGRKRRYQPTPKKVPLLLILRNAIKYEKNFLAKMYDWEKHSLGKKLKVIAKFGIRKSIRKTAHETYLLLTA